MKTFETFNVYTSIDSVDNFQQRAEQICQEIRVTCDLFKRV